MANWCQFLHYRRVYIIRTSAEFPSVQVSPTAPIFSVTISHDQRPAAVRVLNRRWPGAPRDFSLPGCLKQGTVRQRKMVRMYILGFIAVVITKIRNTFAITWIIYFSIYRHLTQPSDGIPNQSKRRDKNNQSLLDFIWYTLVVHWFSHAPWK